MNTKLTFLTLLFAVASFAQQIPAGHLTIFSEDGDKFTLILNDEVINDVPQTNLRVEDLNQPYYNAKIKFEDKSLADISKNNLSLIDLDGIFSDVTYKIKRDKNNKAKMKMNYFSSIPVQPNFVPASNVHVIHYGHPAPRPFQVIGGATQTTTTTTTQIGGTNVGVGINLGGVSMGVSINDSMDGEVISQTTTTTHSGNTTAQNGEPIRGCSGRSCITPSNFNVALVTINNQSFEETRLKTAKQVIASNCLNVDQIIQIANTFNFEDNKLDFCKYAYDYCVDPRNYFKLNGIFNFSSNVDELSDYVQSRQ